MLTPARLREVLHYDPATGVFVWRARTSNRVHVGDVAGYLHQDGYRYLMLDRKNHKAHRLAWLYVYGDWPADQLDHINRERADNRIENLREATNGENQQNRRLTSTNTSGYRGVCWYAQHQRWRATITLNRCQHHLGYFDSAEVAYAAHCDAKARFHTFSPDVEVAQ